MPTASATSSPTHITRRSARPPGASWRRSRAIDRDALSPDERIAYDVFKWQRELDLRGLQPDLLAATTVRPIDHFNGFHAFFAQLSSGEGIAPYKTVKDYENGLARIDDFVRLARRRRSSGCAQGLAAGVVQPRLVMANVLEQLDAMLAEGVEGSSFYRPVANFPGRGRRRRPGAAEGRLCGVDLDRDPPGADPASRLRRRPNICPGRGRASGSAT